ncbi:uncharacterized protein OGAPODRAFT_15446 [Ogataea polymorpha]|uniref:uncharacterized protein n=1 Tax=Ogataea polymorpha TaxID=460523 RepID=UPI0007F4EC17|nr:uncharacterized protein OGAPODRAFT_15446 [Ogataea polymorpha]OBA18836.1 hypothetical protein OGAPODRAFT_15446 [Ogataea polymorpha]
MEIAMCPVNPTNYILDTSSSVVQSSWATQIVLSDACGVFVTFDTNKFSILTSSPQCVLSKNFFIGAPESKIDKRACYKSCIIG